MRGLIIAFVVLLLPTMALAQTTQPAAPPLAETVPMPTPPAADMTLRRVAAISVGAVAGMIILNFATGGMITPILSAGVVDVAPAATVPATAAAAAAVPAAAMAGVDYLATVTQTAVTAVGAIAGGFVGNWLYAR
jgi:hypothetical protein